MTIVYFDEEFADEVGNIIAYNDRICDGWLESAREDFVNFLGNLYEPTLINEVGLQVMKSVLEKALLEEESNIFYLVLVHLLTRNVKEIEVLKYQQANLKIISLTDKSLLVNADFSTPFLNTIETRIRQKFLKKP